MEIDSSQSLTDTLSVITLPQNYTGHAHLANLQSCVILITSPLHAWARAAACRWSKSLFRVKCSFSIPDRLQRISLYHSLFHSPQLLSQICTSLWTNQTLPPFLTAGLWVALYLSATESYSSPILCCPFSQSTASFFSKSVVPRNPSCPLLIPHTPYLIHH